MPEGDSIHRAARRLQALVGERVEVETPHPRAEALNIARRLDGRRLERVEAVGKPSSSISRTESRFVATFG